MWHWKLCHIGFNQVQNLFCITQQDANEPFPSATPRTRQQGNHNAPVGAWPVQTSSPKPILRARNEGFTSEKVRMGLKCLACELAKAKRKQPNNDKSIRQQEMAIRANDLRPGDAVSVDQYHSSLPGRLPNTRGREDSSKRYNGGTIMVDHALGYTGKKRPRSWIFGRYFWMCAVSCENVPGTDNIQTSNCWH